MKKIKFLKTHLYLNSVYILDRVLPVEGKKILLNSGTPLSISNNSVFVGSKRPHLKIYSETGITNIPVSFNLRPTRRRLKKWIKGRCPKIHLGQKTIKSYTEFE